MVCSHKNPKIPSTVWNRRSERTVCIVSNALWLRTGQTSIVDFDKETLCLLFVRVLGGSSKRIPETLEQGVVGNIARKFRELAGLSTSHVVGSNTHGIDGLRKEFQTSDESNDLKFGGIGESVPLFRRAQVGTRMGSASHGERVREDPVGLNAVSNKGSHSNTTVLDFGMTQPANGGFTACPPEFRICQVEGVEELDGRVQALGDGLQVGLCRLHCMSEFVRSKWQFASVE